MTTLMADLVAQQQRGGEPGQHTTEKAKQLLTQILLPKQITGKLIEKYIRKAMRTGAWRKLPPQTKALLYIAKKIPAFRSLFITSVLQQALTMIELFTIKGRAIYYGLIIMLKNTMYSYDICQLKEIVFEKINHLLTIGLNCINRPLLYRLF